MSDALAKTIFTARHTSDGVLLVGPARDWAALSDVPGLRAIEQEPVGSGIRALAFDASDIAC